MKTRLGKRLSALFNCIPPETNYLYDLCCDHGAIGRAVLETHKQCHVVFNDIHPDIMSRLATLLHSFNASNYSLSVCPAEQLQPLSSKRSTIILAGVGDEQCIRILRHLSAIPSLKQAHFIISPATKVQKVRRYLKQNGAKLICESTITENNRTYEIIEVSFDTLIEHRPISEFGYCWSSEDPTHQTHLKKLITFYSAQRNTALNKEYERISLAYKKILEKISLSG